MTKRIGAVLALALVFGLNGPVRAGDDKDVKPVLDKDVAAILDKAIKSLGGDKPAVGIKVTGPEKKDFKLYFDKESGLPVRTVAKIPGLQGDEVTQETNYSEYKEMAGIKKATKVVSKRDGEKFQEQEVTEFK